MKQLRILFLSHLLLQPTTSLQIPLPGGKSISYDASSGVLRIGTPTQSNLSIPPTSPTQIQQLAETHSCIDIRNTNIPMKGYGAFATKELKKDLFLGLYQGDVIVSREALDERVDVRKKHIEDNDGQGGDVMDYVMSLDGGVTFIDGYDRAMDRSSFSPCHLNHADKGTEGCNCIRILENGQVGFFTSQDVQAGEELCFDYGKDFWSDREHLKI